MVYEESFVVDSVRVEMENGMRVTRERDYDRRQAENSQGFLAYGWLSYDSIISYHNLQPDVTVAKPNLARRGAKIVNSALILGVYGRTLGV